MAKKTDAVVVNHGTIYLVRPLTKRAASWIDRNVQDGAQWFGRALVVEHRYVFDLVAGMESDGLVLV